MSKPKNHVNKVKMVLTQTRGTLVNNLHITLHKYNSLIIIIMYIIIIIIICDLLITRKPIRIIRISSKYCIFNMYSTWSIQYSFYIVTLIGCGLPRPSRDFGRSFRCILLVVMLYLSIGMCDYSYIIVCKS